MKKNLSRLAALGVFAVFASRSAVAQLVVYDDAVQNTFQDLSFNNGAPGSSDFNNTAFHHTGTKSIQLNGFNFNAVSFFHSGGQLTTAAYPTLRFWVNGGAASGQSIQVWVYLSANPTHPNTPLDGYVVGGGGIVAGTWKEVRVDLTAAPFNGGAYDRIDLQSNAAGAQAAIYFDDVSLLPPGPPPAAGVITYDPNVALNGLNAERFTWQDSSNRPRSAVLAYNDGLVGTNGARGGALTQFTYQIGAGTRTVNATSYVGGAARAGFGYIVSHARTGPCPGNDDSPLGGFLHDGRDTYERLWEGRHHAVFRFHIWYPRNCDSAGAVNQHELPVTVDWMFATGRDHPVWAVTYDVAGITPALVAPATPENLYNDDSRAPYGEMDIDGIGAANIDGVAWADRYKFTSTGAVPLTRQSTWDWSQPNTIGVPWVKEWMVANDATMGIVQTQTMNQQDAGGARDANVGHDVTTFWAKTSANGSACTRLVPNHVMPCGDDFPFQSIGNSIDGSDAPTNNAHMTWKTQYGFLGQTTYLLNDTVPPHNATTASGYPRKSYSTYIVFGTHTGLPVETQVAQVEAIQSMTLSINGGIGSVVLNGPAGINRPIIETVTYQPPGYNHIYGALAFNASSNQLDATVTVAAGKTLTKPLIIVSNFTGGVYPTVKLAGNTLVQDADYYPSIRPGANELWITLNTTLLAGANHFEILGAAAVPAAPTNVVATAITATRIDISWDPVAGVTFQVDRKGPGSGYAQIAAPIAGSTSYSDTTALANTAYVYQVRAVNGSGPSANSAPDLATTIFFTDTPLNGVAIKAVHLSEIRAAIDAVRLLAGTNGGAPYTDGTAGTTVKAVHINELHTVIDAARAALGLPTPAYIDVIANGVTVKAIHFQELRDRVQ